jgi:DNA-damage-inducible protein D
MMQPQTGLYLYMTQELTHLFHDDETRPNFESYSKENGITFWLATDLMTMLGYETYSSFLSAINKAMSICATLKLPIEENFIPFQDIKDQSKNYKLSRFACFLTAMNCDSRKIQVAAAQGYFAQLAEEAYRRHTEEESESVERVLIREDISDREKSLNSVAKNAGVLEYQFFQNAGYVGMYNLNIAKLRKRRAIPSNRSPLDFMGKTEMAANLFRVTQTEEKIRNQNIKGQKNLENAAKQVGKAVRNTMIETGGTKPEDLTKAEDIKTVRKGLQQTHKQFQQIDGKKKKKKKS